MARCAHDLSETAVHELRLAARHLSPVLEVGLEMEPGNNALRKTRKQLRRILELTSDLRDIQLRRIRLPRTLGPGLLLNALIARTVREEQAEQRQVRKGLKRTSRQRMFRRDLDALGKFTGTAGRKALDAAMGASRKRLRRRIADLNADGPRSLHRVRVAVKRHRYLVGSFALQLPPLQRAQGPKLERLQQRLGRWHDERLLAEWIEAQQHELRPALRSACASLAKDRMAWCELEQHRLVRAVERLTS